MYIYASLTSDSFTVLGVATSQALPPRDASFVPRLIYSPETSTESSTIYVLFVGQLYNEKTLRERFNLLSGSVESLIAEMYRRLGETSLSLLDGAYGLAIMSQSQLVLARDENGLEHVYFSVSKDRVVVSSSVKALRHFVPLRVDSVTLPRYFLLPQLDSRDTLFADVNQVGIREAVTISTDELLTRRTTYDKVQYEVATPDIGPTDAEILDTVEQLLRHRVQTLINAFRTPVVYNTLSGGNDSTLTQCVLNQLGCRNSVCANYAQYGSDAAYSMDVARHLGTKHSIIEIHATRLFENIEKGIAVTEQPLMFEGESMFTEIFSAIDSAESASAQRLCFNSNGADALFGSRKPLMLLHFLERYALMSSIANHLFVLPVSRARYEILGALLRATKTKTLDAAFYFAFGNLLSELQIVREAFEIDDSSKLIATSIEELHKYPGSIQEKAYRFGIFAFNGNQQINSVNYKLAKHRNVHLLLPFMDRELTRFMLGVPTWRKMQNLTEKYYAKKLLERYLPKAYIYRRKIYKNVPWRTLFRNDVHFSRTIEEIVERRYPYFNFDRNAFYGSTPMFGKKLINFHLWHKRFID